MTETSLTEARETEGVEPKAGPRKRILLVEGDGFTRLVLLLRLRLAGFGVDFTSNGILGLGKLRSCHPDVLLLELKLCGMSGLELIKAARAEPGFGDRPIYVYTNTERMNRSTRKELSLFATKVFDKGSITREDLVQTFASISQDPEPAREKRATSKQPPAPARRIRETVPAGAIEELVSGVREQSEHLAKEKESRAPNSAELLSRVCSLASCAEVAGLSNLARQAKALENFLIQLCRSKDGFTSENLRTVAQAVEVMRHMSFDRNGEEQKLIRYTTVLLDEAPASNQAMHAALREAGFEPHCFEEAALARAFLTSNRTDLIIANIILPEAHSLTLSDIHQLPLHADAKVIFGPDSTATSPLGERLPTNAARFDNDALLLTSIVVRALNEVQGAGTQAPLDPEPATAETGAFQTNMRNPAANQSFDDGFDLFARTSSTSSDRVMESEPGSIDQNCETELMIRQVTTPIDESQLDERPIELLPPPDLVAQEEQSPQPELPAEDNTAAASWLAADNADSSHPIEAQNETSELQASEPLAVETSAATTSNYEEFMSNQSQNAPAYAPQCDNGQPGEPLEAATPEREDLATRVCAAEMALHHARIELDQKDRAIASLQEHLAEATVDQGDNRLESTQDAQARCAELEQELAAVRQALDDFNGSFSQQQQAAAEAGKYVEELEQRLSQNTAEREKHRQEQEQAQANLRQQLEAANATKQETEAARQQLEQELGLLRQQQQELASKLSQEQKAGAEASARLKQLETKRQEAEAAAGSDPEQQIRQGVSALARVTAELAKERGERQRSEQRTAELNERLQALHHDLSRTLHAQREDLARISALEEQQRQTSQSLERRTADLEQLQAERQLSEERLQKEKELSAQLRKDLSFFDEINKKFGGTSQELQTQLEASLNTARDNEAKLEQKNAEQQRLAESLEGLNQQLQKQTRRTESLEQELQNAQQALHEREAKLHKESAERQQLKEALESAQRNLRGGSERDLEFSKLQSALQLEQVERKRQEAQLARIRHSALDSAHAARSLRAGLRRQIREPVDNLVESARSLLELEMGDAQKKLAESVLQDVLLVQTRLREPENAQGESVEPTATPGPTET